MGLEPTLRHLAQAPRPQVSWLLGVEGSIPAAPRSLRTGRRSWPALGLPHSTHEGSPPVNRAGIRSLLLVVVTVVGVPR